MRDEQHDGRSAGGEYHPPPKAIGAERERELRRIVGLPVEGEETPPPNATTRLVGHRVDALVIAFRLNPDRLAMKLLERLDAAAEGAVELMLGRFAFSLKTHKLSGCAQFENADVRGILNLKASGGWHLEIVVRAVFLATHPLEQALQLVCDVADAFGPVLAGPRLRRVDLAADFAGFALSERDAERFATLRANVNEYREEAKDTGEVPTAIDSPRLRVHRNSTARITGYSVSTGNPFSARIYDKIAELLLPNREEKRAIEHAQWERHGWNGNGPVTRVEFQIRGEALDTFGARDARELPSRLDELWQYATRKWLKIIDPESASRRHRCDLDPRWLAVQAVCFVHEASPAKRVRCRGGAQPEQALGSSLSMLAARGLLKRIDTGCDKHGEVLDELGFVKRMSEAAAEEWAREQASELCGEAGRAAIEDLAAKRGWRNATLVLVTRINAAVARFSSIDDFAKDART
jgi:hypothetical protein